MDCRATFLPTVRDLDREAPLTELIRSGVIPKVIREKMMRAAKVSTRVSPFSERSLLNLLTIRRPFL
jgi:hypothetical protein